MTALLLSWSGLSVFDPDMARLVELRYITGPHVNDDRFPNLAPVGSFPPNDFGPRGSGWNFGPSAQALWIRDAGSVYGHGSMLGAEIGVGEGRVQGQPSEELGLAAGLGLAEDALELRAHGLPTDADLARAENAHDSVP